MAVDPGVQVRGSISLKEHDDDDDDDGLLKSQRAEMWGLKVFNCTFTHIEIQQKGRLMLIFLHWYFCLMC